MPPKQIGPVTKICPLCGGRIALDEDDRFVQHTFSIEDNAHHLNEFHCDGSGHTLKEIEKLVGIDETER